MMKTDNTINGRTPEEIKRGLECCGKGNACRGHCPYDGPDHGIKGCTGELSRDALAYIQQLERERDAAVEALCKIDETLIEHNSTGTHGCMNEVRKAVNDGLIGIICAGRRNPMNKFEPKSIRYRGEAQKPFADCSSFPKVDFSKFDFPIKIIESPMDIRVEKEMFSAIKRVGVQVDKEELLRALNYERDQYAYGYISGHMAAQPKWISVEERLPEEFEDVIVFSRVGSNTWIEIAHHMRGQWWRVGVPMVNVTHWMPLPEPPKEDNDANA